ncbi:hypothetical protein DLM_1062 [Aquitalea magnusonii]|uniref:Uncharacterized protein n=1 Tax=Aquitalea magnusonii TaxID=332411 RepID=A0A3G9GF15_9NEIS|nr:hypothetical protein DLM_1062 [Aquitalea magnusonii]
MRHGFLVMLKLINHGAGPSCLPCFRAATTKATAALPRP